MNVPLNDVKRQNDPLRADLESATRRVIASGWFVMGKELEQFERLYADYCGVRHCLGVGCGTDALEIALRAVGVGAGMEVATVANAGFYGSTAILAIGATPLYIDVDPSDWTMSPDDLASRVTERTKAIIVTHLYGRMADMPALLKVARQKGIALVEDGAQAHGAELAGKKAGAWGDVACFSFYPTKNLGALGDAGAVVTGDDGIAQRVRHLRQYGWTRRYTNETPGGRCSRLDELQSACLGVKLSRLDEWNRQRRAIGLRFNDQFKSSGHGLPSIDTGHVCHLYVMRVKNRDGFRSALEKQGIQTEVHYPIPDHLQKIVKEAPFARCRLPVTEMLANEVVTLPCFPELDEAERDAIVAAVRSV